LSCIAADLPTIANAVSGFDLAISRTPGRHASTSSCSPALTATFAVHVGYSYARHVATGWLLNAYPRYYLPLAAIVPLAALSLLTAIEAPRWRAALLAFLIASPILYRIFGAPFGS